MESHVSNQKTESIQNNEQINLDLTDFAESSFNNNNNNNHNNNPNVNFQNYNNNNYSINSHVRVVKVNRQLQEVKYCSNSIRLLYKYYFKINVIYININIYLFILNFSTSKYNIFTFLPKFLFEQFRKYSNIFFFIIVLLQVISNKLSI